MTEEEKTRSNQIVERAMRDLGEHFEHVRIFVNSSNPGGGTIKSTKGCGNYYAQYGQVREWLTQMDEDGKIERRKEQL